MTTTYGDAANEGNKHRRAQLKDDGQEMDKFVECVYRERLATEKVRETCERRVLEVQATREVAEAASTEEKAANKSEQEVQETHQLKSNEAVEKVPMQSRFLESGSVEVNRAKDSIELQRSEDLTQWLAKRDGWLTNLRVCQEQLRHSFQQWEKISQPEKEEVVTAPKASELKAEEPSEKLRELETYLTRLKEQTSNLEERCISTETKAGESSSLPCQLQTKLDYATTELSEAKDLNSDIDAMKLRLEVRQKELSQALILGALAESSLSELKLREEHMEEVDQSKKKLEVRLRWRNEQFQSLEEAHAKLRIQLKEKSSEWDTEKSALFSDIDSLHSTLDSKDFFLRELQKQLQMVHHALSCEEGRRKALELETAKSSQGLQQATAGYKEAQTTLETLRVQLSAEIGTLRNALGAKDRQLKDLHVNFVHMEQEYKELKEIEKEYRAWASNHEEQQQQSLSMKEEISGVVEAHDNLRSRMKALEIDSERERRGLVKALDQAHDHLSLRDETLKQVDSELVRVKIALEHAQGNCSCLDIQLKQCEAQLGGACEEATTARRALASLEKNIYVEKSFLLESLLGKDKVIQDLKAQIHSMDQTISELSMHEEEHLLMQRDYEELQRQEIQRDAGRKSLESIHNSVLLRVSQEENAWLADRKILYAELQVTQERANAVEKQFHEVRCENERHLDVIRKLEARCAFHDKEMAQHCLLTDQTKEQLALERTEVENEMIEARTMNESLSAASSKKDVTVERLKDRIENLEAGLRRKDEETCSHNERVSHVEKELRETAEVLCNMEEQIALIESQACKTATERKLFEDVRTNLVEVTRKCQEESLAAKADLDGKLEVARRDLSVLSMQLTAVNQELLDVSCQKELALKDLDTKESFLTKLTLEHKTLLADRGSLEQVVQVLQIKKGDLVQEVESSRATIKQLCNKYEAAQSSLASSVNEVKDLHAKLQNAHTVRVQLLKAEEQNRDLEGYLKAAKAIAQDKEEKLAASEWTVQQLALDIGKAKAVLTQKDREDALMRDELADVERELRAKEGAFIEMECYLEDALLSRVSMQREIDQLRQQMEDLDRGTADWKRMEQDMAIQLQVVGAALEEKRASLVACELEIKSGNDMREVMDGAIDSLKLQLADEQTALSAQRKDMNRLCEDLERSKSEASSASRLVKDLQGKLQQLEHSGAVRINQFQSSLSELRDELSLAHHQLDKYQDRTRLFMEESSRYKEKFETLLDLNTRRDSSLKDLEAQLSSARAGALDQSKMLEQRDQDLQRAKEQRERQDQRLSLEDSLTRIQSQRCELQLDNEKLLLELRKLSVQLGVSSTEVALKSKEIQSLHIQLEQTRLLGAQEGERQTLMTTLVDEAESPQAFQERERCLRAMQSSLHEAQEKRQVLQRNLVGKESDTEIFVEKLSTAEKRCEVPEELSKLQEALTLAHSTLSGKSEISSLHFRAINAVEVEIASRKEKPGSNFNETSSLTQELHGASSLALESEEIVFEMQETLEGIQSELKANAEKLFHAALVEDTQSTLKEWTEKSAVVLEKKVALNASASKGVTVKAPGTLKNKEDEGSKGHVVMKILQGELATHTVKEAAACEFARQLKVTQDRAEFYQQQVCDLQGVLRKSAYDLEEKIEQNSFYISLFSALQDEWLELKSRVATAEGKVESLKIQLEDAEERRCRCHQEDEQVNEAMIRLEYDLIEASGNVLGFTLLEHALNDEMTKVVESTSLIRDIQAQAEAWKDVAVDPQGDKLKQEVLLIHEAMKLVEHGRFEDDLLDERMKAAEIDALNLQLHVEGWKCKAEDAAKEGERVNQELKCAGSTISSLVLQVETHQRVECAMKELIDSLQVDMNVARKVAYARRGKMEIFLHELEQSRGGEKELLENLQMEQKRLITDVVDDRGFDCTFDIDAYLKMPIQGPGNIHNIRAAKYGIRDDGVRPKFHLEEFQNSSECSFGTVNEALGNELENLRLHAEESQRQEQEVCGKLDAALSDVATKNLIIKQMHDEISSLRSLVKRVEQGTMSVGDSLHGERHKYSTDASILTTGRDDRQQSTSPGKRKAEIQEELNNYLDLCGSLVRKNVRLEKQLDGLQRKNRGLQMQVEGFQSTGTSSLNKERKAVDPVDCSTELILRGFSRSVFKPDFQERRMVSLQNICTGNVLGEIDENTEPGSSERCPMNQKPPGSRRPAMQQRKQNA